ncbi:hypothetical protein F4X73_08280 [Candidatus Poribacteria bacterium]|nr:hypothetical protein [Candidatus Poribacteria bacterium]MYF55491.1 hypothetical protein [Candidatus Poribacteria bacterium]
MPAIVIIALIVCGSITLTILGCVSMGTSYAEKKRGLQQGASQRDLEALQQQVSKIHDEIDSLKIQLQELIQIAKGITQ